MRLNKYEAQEYRRNKLGNALKGEGLYVYRNATKADLVLPKPAKNGVKMIGPGKEFHGDSYFMQMVKTNEVRLVRTLITPEEQKEIKMAEEKLLLDQPDTITTEGTVEHVIVKPELPLNEAKKPCCCGGGTCNENKEVLINEDPMDGVDIIG